MHLGKAGKGFDRGKLKLIKALRNSGSFGWKLDSYYLNRNILEVDLGTADVCANPWKEVKKFSDIPPKIFLKRYSPNYCLLHENFI